MSKRFLLIVGLLMTGVIILSGCVTAAAASEDDDDGHNDGEHMDDDHADDEHADDDHEEGDHMDGSHVHVDPPAAFADLENPFAGSHEAAEAGEALFVQYCTPCHGASGNGDGPLAETLDPRPANLADASMMADMSDAYMFWRVSEGGTAEPFNSAMPSWSLQLDEDQRWQLVTFVRELPEHGH